MTLRTRSPGITAVSLFFAFGATMSGLTALILLFPSSPLDALWRLNPRAREGFAIVGVWAVPLMAAVCVACVTTAVGLWRCKRWGLWGAVIILSVNFVGDVTNALVMHDGHTLIGLPIGAAMIVYLCSKRTVFVR